LSRLIRNIRRVKCPAEENANCEKSPPINARKNCGKTDIRANRLIFIELKFFIITAFNPKKE